MLKRRQFVTASLTLPGLLTGAQAAPAGLLREGGLVLALRHALAPGTFDPPQFTLGNCSTQRNLNDAGRQQALQIGAWFQAQGLKPARVRSSPWCRCIDTAQLAFGSHDTWAALGSPRAGTETTNAQSMQALRAGLQAASRQRGRFEVWVTHMFVQSDLAGQGTGSGEGLLLRAGTDGAPQVLGRWALS
jgi:hypothetical protein